MLLKMRKQNSSGLFFRSLHDAQVCCCNFLTKSWWSTFFGFFVLNFAYSASVFLSFSIIQSFDCEPFKFCPQSTFSFLSIVYKTIEMLQLWVYNEWSSSNPFHMDSGPVCTSSTQHSLIQLKPARLRLLQPTRSLQKMYFKKILLPHHRDPIKDTNQGRKTRG